MIQVRQQSLSWREIDDGVAILDMIDSSFYELNGSGAFLWLTLAEASSSVEELTDRLKARYQLDQSVAEQHTLEFVESLRELGLLDA